MNPVIDDRGIRIPEADLWLDAREPAENCWISHAHSDHARPGHGRVFASPQTLDLCRLRFGAAPANATALEWGRPVEFGAARLTAFPAGHILGAAQLLVELDGKRLIYTGDMKVRDPLLGDPTVIVPCDHLIVESTFGLPIFHFLSAAEAVRRMVAFANECLMDGVTPVFLGYPLGRGQEITHTLCHAGIPVAVHGAIAKLIPGYERAGYEFPGWAPYEAGDLGGRALVIPPGFRATVEASGADVRVAYVSGWALLDNARARSGADELIPYSDHAGFDELLEFVDRCGARRIDVVHGYTDAFARLMRAKGIDARAAGASFARTDMEDSTAR